MARTCDNCGADLFIGETRCPQCRAVIETRASTATPIPTTPPGERGEVPPDGLQLLIDKQRADKDSYRYREDHYREDRAPGGFLDPLGRSTFDDELDAIGEVMRPERDRHGNIQWDAKNAIIGAIVLAVVAGIIYYLVSRGGVPLKTSTVLR